MALLKACILGWLSEGDFTWKDSRTIQIYVTFGADIGYWIRIGDRISKNIYLLFIIKSWEFNCLPILR